MREFSNFLLESQTLVHFEKKLKMITLLKRESIVRLKSHRFCQTPEILVLLQHRKWKSNILEKIYMNTFVTGN